MARLTPPIAVLAALLIGYMAHDFASAGAQASVTPARGASASQLSTINRKLSALTTKLGQVAQQDAQITQQDAQVAQVLGGRGVEGLGIAQVLDQVNIALLSVRPNAALTCLIAEQPSGQQANCSP